MTPQETVERALALSRADGLVAIADEQSTANLRWAGNSLTTNGVTRSRALTVIATVGGKQGTAAGVVSRSGATGEDLEPLVRAAEEAARESGPSDDAQPLVQPADAPNGGAWEAPPAETSAAVFDSVAPALGDTFRRAESERRLLFGYAEHEQRTTYLGSTTGLRLRHDQPTGTFELNGKSPDYSRSAWAGTSTRDFTDVDVTALDAEVRTRLGWAERRVDLPAGRYETLLPPSTVADLLFNVYMYAAARDAADGRTAFARTGGGTRVGERLTDVPLTLYSDPASPGLECCPFLVAHGSSAEQSVFDNGLPTGRVNWIDSGTLGALLQTRHSAAITDLPTTPFVDNLVADGGGSKGVDELVAGTERGLLLTCLWYIRVVDPQTLLLTGLTRDGVYLVENGEVTGAVNNFRFNESPVGLLSRITEVGRTEPALGREFGDYFSRTAMPALRVPDFNMSTVSDAS
ncbi:MAG: metallopeptidase TldD-related protein [Streptosporangiales bacterium]